MHAPAFFETSTFMAGSFAALWAARMRIIFIESPNLPYYPNAYVQEHIIEDKNLPKIVFLYKLY